MAGTLFPPWYRYVRWALEAADYWQGQTWPSDTDAAELTIPSVAARKCSVVYSRTTPAGITEDVAMFSLHFLSRDPAGGDLMPAWSGGMYTALESALGTWWTAVKAYYPAHWILREYRWHRFGTDLPKGTTGARKEGPIERLTSVGVAGTSASVTYHPDQVALSVTLRTASRKHWGRFYLPPPNTQLTAEGRFGTAVVDGVAAATRTLINSAATADTPLIVWSPKNDGAFSVTELAVDDTPDVIRRRRAKHSTYWKVYNS